MLIAPNSMKGSLYAVQFADIIESAFKDVDPNYYVCKKNTDHIFWRQ